MITSNSFGVRDMQATSSKHQVAMGKVRERVAYRQVVNDGFFASVVEQTNQKLGLYQRMGLKTAPRTVRTIINGITYQEIINHLEAKNYPKSWVTAFYMVYYEKINSLMEEVVRSVS
jgi:hypothetical protein